MKIALLEPFFTGSHQAWAEGYQQSSQHDVDIFSLPGRHWKWRMHGGAITLADQFNNSSFKADLILATDMLDLSVFMALTKPKTKEIPTALYFHENQLTYPWSPKDRDAKSGKNFHYAFINYTSALAADRCFFNSQYHLTSFLNALPIFLKQYPDNINLETVEAIKNRSEVLYLGMDLGSLYIAVKERKEKTKYATLLWNHRWEYDKNPDQFFHSLFELKERGIRFNLIVLGQELDKCPDIFAIAKKRLENEIIHWGYTQSKEEYAKLLWLADILPVTSNQDFFGGSVIEAVACNTIPLLPKRLAYLEHFTETWQQRQFYYNPLDLTNRLQRMIVDVSILRKQEVSGLVNKYDWQTCIPQYNSVLENSISVKKSGN